MPLTAKHGGAKFSGATRLGHRLVASLLDFETAMTIADYTAIGVLDRIGDIGRGDAVSARQVITGAQLRHGGRDPPGRSKQFSVSKKQGLIGLASVSSPVAIRYHRPSQFCAARHKLHILHL